MELEEDEAQVCRLCGQCESIYIDVFGEEGTKRFLGFKIQSKINILIKPDDGLPQVICMRCLGTLEFLCDFHSMCHNTQKNFESTTGVENKVPKDKLESDAESDKENVLPTKHGKRKGKLLQSEQTKLSDTVDCDENIVSQNIENSNDQHIESSQKQLDVSSNGKIDDEKDDKTLISDIISKDVNLQSDKTPKSKDPIIETAKKSSCRRSRLVKCENLERKMNRRSKASQPTGNKNKKIDNKQKVNKTIDKFFSAQSPSQVKPKNEENVNPNHVEIKMDIKDTENLQKENVLFEGTVINSADNTSTIMPLKTETLSHELKLDDVIMDDGSGIVQAQEIIWISNNSQLPEPGKPKTFNTNQSKTTSPAPGDEAESIKADGKIVVQTSGQDMNLTTSTEQLIVLEVQLPTKENSIALPKSTELFNRNRSFSTTSSMFSEGKFAKVSELMTEKQKKEIEAHYTVDMSIVDEFKVDENIITVDRCKYQCKICEVIYPRLDKCQVHIWRHLDMKPYLCKVCDFATLTVSNIRCHIRKSHLKIKPFECHLCNKRYNSATLLEEHINIHTGLRPYQCNFCEFASTSKQVLVHHILTHKSEKDVICDVCGKAFYSKGRMRAHKITHNKDKAFKCSLCSTYVLHEEALERHYLNVHTKDYVCKICNKVYKSRKALHNHEGVHSDAKFKCPMCPNVYKSTHILKEHILKHQGIRQYKCNSCDKSFAQQSHLAAHMAVHSNITYNCPGCHKGFNRHDNMKVHTKRCEIFLANPELQNLLTKRKISFSKNNTAKVSVQKERDNVNKTNNIHKTSKRYSDNKTGSENETAMVTDLAMNYHKTNVVEHVLTSQEF